jgi:cytochrome c oxidase cbb3-type subunit 3
MLESHEHKHAVHEFDGIIENRVTKPPVYFTILFYGLILWGVLFIGWYLLSGWSSQDEFAEKMAAHTGAPVTSQAEPPTPTKTAAVSEAEEIDSEELFAARCAGCHGSEGEGAFGPDLTASSYQYGKDRASVHESIANGRPKNMPAFSDSFSAAEIDALTDYVLDL